MYDQFAEIYDETRGQEALPLSAVALRWLGTETSVLDVGVGTGLTVPSLEAAGHKVVGVDQSGRMLAKARQRCPTAPLLHADAAALPFFSGSFRRAIALQVFQIVPNPTPLLSEIRRTLAPGGELLAAPIDVEEPRDIINLAYWQATLDSGGLGTLGIWSRQRRSRGSPATPSSKESDDRVSRHHARRPTVWTLSGAVIPSLTSSGRWLTQTSRSRWT